MFRVESGGNIVKPGSNLRFVTSEKGHSDRDIMLKVMALRFCNVTTKHINIYKMFCEKCGLTIKGQEDKSIFVHFILIDLFTLFFIDFFINWLNGWVCILGWIVTIFQLLHICDNFSCLLSYLYISKYFGTNLAIKALFSAHVYFLHCRLNSMLSLSLFWITKTIFPSFVFWGHWRGRMLLLLQFK